jgi:2'-5' RNA ligase
MDARDRQREAKKRLFFALVPPPELQAELRAQVESALDADPRGADFRLVATEEVHVTLLFLGAFASMETQALQSAFVARTSGLAAPHLWIRGTGAFPDFRNARILWLGIRDDAGALADLHRELVEAARATSWRPDPRERERPFHAHLTVARSRSGRGAVPPRSFTGLILERPWLPDAIVLLESHLDRASERYQVLARVVLGGSERGPATERGT